MTLQLPKAGTNPGRAARTVPLAEDNSGARLGDLGERIAQVGQALTQERLDREFKRNQVDMTRELNDLRLEAEAIGDPDQAEDFWQSGVSNLRNTYLGDETGTGGKLSKRNQENFGLAFDELSNRHAFSLGARALELRQSQRAAIYDQYKFEAVRSAATADPRTRADLIATGDKHIEDMVAAGILNAEGAVKARQDLRNDMIDAVALEGLSTDPASYLERDKAGEFDDMDPKTRVRYRAAATDALVKEAAAAQKAAEKAEADQKSEVRSNLTRIASLGDTTRLDPRDRALLDSPEIKALAKGDEEINLAHRKALARVSLDEDKELYSGLSPAELSRVIEDERGRPVRHQFQEERLELLEDLHERVEKAVATDAIGHVKSLGIGVPPLELDQGVAALEQSIAARLQLSDWMQERGFISAPVIFQPDERKKIKATLSVDADPGERETVIAGLTRQLGPDAMRVIEKATGDKATAHSASLVAFGAPQDVVSDILTGQKRMADGTANRPAEDALNEVFDDVTGGMFRDQPELQARLMRAAEALYAEDNPLAETSSVDDDELRKAVNRALGGDGDEIGGLVRVDPPGARNRYELPVPPGVSERDLANTLDQLTRGLRRRPVRDAGGNLVQPTKLNEPDLGAFAAAAADGHAPDFGSGSAAAVFEEMRIVPLWADGKPTDRYVFIRETAAGPIALKNTAGGRYEFSMRRLVREAAR